MQHPHGGREESHRTTPGKARSRVRGNLELLRSYGLHQLRNTKNSTYNRKPKPPALLRANVKRAEGNQIGTEGYIHTNGMQTRARHRPDGLNRRWDYDFNEGRPDQSFVISPDGLGRIYDFSISEENTKGVRTAESSMTLKCE